MSVTENHQMLENGASTAVEEHNETMAAEPGAGVHEQDETQVPPLGLKSSAGTSDSGEKRTANSEERPANVKLCLHVKEDGVFCHCPALGGRQYCYRHLRLRGQQMRMARAIAQRQPYHLVLPPLEDMNSVQAALTHVTAALTAGLLERRHAGLLLYALQQASSNLRFLARLWREGGRAAARSGGISRIRGRVWTADGTGPDAPAPGGVPSSGESRHLGGPDYAPDQFREPLDQGSH